MKQCTLYLTLAKNSDLTAMVQECFPGWAVSQGADASSLILSKRKLFTKKNIVFSTKSFEKDGADFKTMQSGMHNFFAAVETEHDEVKKKLLAQILVFTVVVGVVANHDLEAQTVKALTKITDQGHGLILLPPGTLLDGQNRQVFNLSGETELLDHVVTAPAELLDRHVVITESGEKRKIRSTAILTEKGIPVAKSLPPIVGDENYAPRSKEEVAGRTLAILITSVYAELLSSGDPKARAIAQDLLKQYGVEKYLSPDETEFLNNPDPGQTLVVNMAWRYECAWVGLWALGFEKELSYPEAICNVSAMGSLIREMGDWDTIIEKAVLRKPSEILDEADLIYRYDWACVDARIKGQNAPANLDAGVVVERHRMFNWLIRYLDADWDDISTDT